MYRKLLFSVAKNKTALIFAGVVAAAVIGKKVLESDVVKDTATRALAEVMSIKADAERTVDEMKADAEEIVVEAKE